MAISFVASAVPAGNPTTSYNITIPTVAVNDLLILATTNRDADTAPTVIDNDTGGETWTEKSSVAGCGRLFYKRATSATSAKAISASGFTGSCSGVLIVLRGAKSSGDPFHQYTHEPNASGDETHAGFTTTIDGCWIGLAVHNDGNDNLVTNSACTSPGSLTEGGEKQSVGGSDCSCSVRGLVQATAGATGDFTWAQTNGATVSQAFAVEPAPPAQSLTPGLFSDDDTFHAPTVTVGAVTLTPGLFTDGDTFFAPTVAAVVTLTPSLFTDEDTFYSPTVSLGDAVEGAPTEQRGTGGWGAGLNARRRVKYSLPIPLSSLDRKPEPVIAKPALHTPAVILNPLVDDDEEEIITLMLHGIH